MNKIKNHILSLCLNSDNCKPFSECAFVIFGSLVKIFLHNSLEVTDVCLQSVWGFTFETCFEFWSNLNIVWVENNIDEESSNHEVMNCNLITTDEFCVSEALGS